MNRRRWIGVVAILLIIPLAALILRRSEKRVASAPPSRAIPVVTAKAVLGDQPVYLTGLGSVAAFNTVTLRTRVDGELIQVAVREGQMVSAGDLIAEIDPRPFQVQLEQAEAQKQKDEALLANAQLDLRRYQILYSEDSIPKQQLDTQAATVQQDQAAVRADQAAIDNANLQLAYTRVTSPINGRIGLRQVDPGNIIHTTDANGVAVITQLHPISVIFSLPEHDVLQVMPQLRAGKRLVVEAWDRDLTREIAKGYLVTYDNQADVTTGTVRFKADFANEANVLFPNQFVNARLLVQVQRNVVLIPSASVQYGPETPFVFVVQPDRTVQTRNVVVGPIERDTALIERGLAAGEIVVTEGVDKLQEGATVEPSP